MANRSDHDDRQEEQEDQGVWREGRRPSRHDHASVDGRWLERPAFLISLSLLYSLIILYLCLLPMVFEPMSMGEAWRRFVVLPLLAAQGYRISDLATHFVALLPLGFFAAMAVVRLKQPAGRVFWGGVCWGLILVFPVLIEFLQLWVPDRNSTWMDVYSGWAGMILGWILGGLFGDHVAGMMSATLDHRRQHEARRGLFWLYVVGLFLFLMMPFDFRFSLFDLERKWSAGMMTLGPAGWGEAGAAEAILSMLRKVAVWLPIAVAVALRPAGRRSFRPTGLQLLYVTMAAASVEVLRIPLMTAHSSPSHILAAPVSLMVARWMVGRVLTPEGELAVGRNWPRRFRMDIGMACGWLYLAAVGIALLHPWRPRLEWTYIRERWLSMIDLPFVKMYLGGEWQALEKAMLVMVIFIPAGACFRFGTDRRLSNRLGILLAVASVTLYGVGVELLQGVVQADRYGSPTPDLSDVVLYVTGALLGWLMMGVFLPAEPGSEIKASTSTRAIPA